MDAPQPLSAEQLQLAWEQRRRPTWPATFDEAMAHPIYSHLVRLQAAHGHHPAPVVQRPPVQAPAPPTEGRPWRPPPRRVQAAMFDPRRAATGERDED